MRLPRSLPGFLAALVLVATGCSGPANRPAERGSGSPAAAPASGAFPVTITDDDGIAVTMKSPPQRIVTFAPSNTEIVFALGLGARLVGVSGRFDDYPPAARKIDEIGGAGDFGVDPNIEKVVALQPDLMLAISGGEQWKDRLRELGIPVFTINATGFDDLVHDIRTVGRLTGATVAAEQLASKMQEQERTIVGDLSSEPRVTCFFEAFYPPLTTVGPDTFIADLLAKAGCDSVSASAKTDYPEWSVEDLVKENPSVYLVSSESGASPAAVAARPGFDAVDAVAHGDVVPVNSDLVSRPGPRVVLGLRALAEALHPDAFP